MKALERTATLPAAKLWVHTCGMFANAGKTEAGLCLHVHARYNGMSKPTCTCSTASVHIYSWVNMWCTRKHSYVKARTPVHTFTDDACTDARTYTRAHTHTHAHTHIQAHVRTYVTDRQIHRQTNWQTHECVHVCMHAYTSTHIWQHAYLNLPNPTFL